jgi:hypothetical protein
VLWWCSTRAVGTVYSDAFKHSVARGCQYRDTAQHREETAESMSEQRVEADIDATWLNRKRGTCSYAPALPLYLGFSACAPSSVAARFIFSFVFSPSELDFRVRISCILMNASIFVPWAHWSF